MPVRASGAGEQQERTLRANESGRREMAQAISEETNRAERAGDRFQQQLQQGISAYGQYKAEEKEEARYQEQVGLKKKELGLEAARSGLEWQEGGGRQQQVEQEMAKGAGQPPLVGPPTAEQKRAQEQGQKGMEYGRQGGEGRWVQSETAQRASQQQAQVEAYEAETRRMNAEASMVSAQSKMLEAQKAKQSGDMVSYANLTDEARKGFNEPAANWTKEFDRFTSGEIEPKKVEALFGMQSQKDPKLAAALQEYRDVGGDVDKLSPKNFERFNSAWKSGINMKALESIVKSQGMESQYLDLGSPMGQAFSQQVVQANTMLAITSAMEKDALFASGMNALPFKVRKFGPGYFKSYDDQQRFARAYAASMVFMQFQVAGTDGPRAMAPGGGNGGTPIGQGAESKSRYGATSTEPANEPGFTRNPEQYERRGGRVQQRSTAESRESVRATKQREEADTSPRWGVR